MRQLVPLAVLIWILTGPAAETFIHAHFPHAEIPGKVKGWVTIRGIRHAYAVCVVPEMGEGSNGAVSRCWINYR